METHTEVDCSHEECSEYSSPGSYPFSSSSSSDSEDTIVKKAICNINDIRPNIMRGFDFETREIVLVLQRGKFYAVSAQCPHCEHSLLNGSLGRRRVRCSHCGSCFSFVTGNIEDAPAMNRLPCYQVDVEYDTVYVSMTQRDLRESGTVLLPTIGLSGTSLNRRYGIQETGCGDKTRGAGKTYKQDEKSVITGDTHIVREKIIETFVVVGGGPCAALCIEQLRLLGFTGRLIAFMQEPHLPYDRTMLSKLLDINIRDILLRSSWFYDRIGVEIYRSTTVQSVNVEDRTLIRNDGGVTSFDKVFIATGCRAKVLSPEIPGVTDAAGVFYLRTINDVHAIQEAINENLDLVIIGSSFLSMETAVTCLPRVKSITIVSKGAYPFQNVFGSVIGKRILKLYTEMGINFHMSSEIVKLVLHQDTLAVTGVVLGDGISVPTQMVIACIGVAYNTKLLAGSGVALASDGAILVDKYLKTNIPFVFAGGDVACAPLHPFFDTLAATRHYQSAQMQGRVAAATMLGMDIPVQTIPFANVALGEVTLQLVGWTKKAKDIEIVGDLDNLKFAAYYFDGDQATAMVTCGLGALAAKFAETIHMEKYVSRDSLRDHVWTSRMFMCPVHNRDEDYTLDLNKLKAMGIVF